MLSISSNLTSGVLWNGRCCCRSTSYSTEEIILGMIKIFLLWISLVVIMGLGTLRKLRYLWLSVRSAKDFKALSKIFHYVETVFIQGIWIIRLFSHNGLNLINWIEKGLEALSWLDDSFKMLIDDFSPQFKNLFDLFTAHWKRCLLYFLLKIASLTSGLLLKDGLISIISYLGRVRDSLSLIFRYKL
jgi:hypothetical protein